MRGTPQFHLEDPVTVRIIPAYAGNTSVGGTGSA